MINVCKLCFWICLEMRLYIVNTAIHSDSSVQFSCSVVSHSLQPHELQHARLPCPSPTPRPCSNSESIPGGPVDENSPASAGDTSSIPGPGRFHVPRGNSACAPQLLSLCSRACALQQEKSPQWEATAMRGPPHHERVAPSSCCN